MTLVIKGAGLTIEDVVNVARNNEKVELDKKAIERINVCRAMLEKKIEAHEIMYGVNTGIGEFSEVVLNDDQVKDFQKYLIYNHAAGIGDPMPHDWVRGAMLGRINVHAHGNSGSRIESRRHWWICSIKGLLLLFARRVQWAPAETLHQCRRSLC